MGNVASSTLSMPRALPDGAHCSTRCSISFKMFSSKYMISTQQLPHIISFHAEINIFHIKQGKLAMA